MQSCLPGPTSCGPASSIRRRIFRWYIFLLTVVTVVIALATAWPRLKPTTYDENLNLPSWDALSTQLKTTPQRQRIPGYEREQFGSGWGRKGVCTTREAALLSAATTYHSPRAEDYSDTQYAQPTPQPAPQRTGKLPEPTDLAACTIVDTQIWDEYAGTPIPITDSPREIDIDHIFPLSAAWDLGAHSWDHEQRRKFANDGRNLVPTDASANREKSDSLPAAWMPSDDSAHCWYARRVAFVAVLYDLKIPEVDARKMTEACTLFSLLGR